MPWGDGDLSLLKPLVGDPAMTAHLGGPESPGEIAERQGRGLAAAATARYDPRARQVESPRGGPTQVAAMRVLITGWFSTDDGEITAGDMLAGRTVSRWLAEAGVPHDIAVAAGFRGPDELAADAVDPRRYSDVLFVCGPVASAKVERLVRRFMGCRRIGVGISLTAPAARLFDVVLARDGVGPPSADVSLGSAPTAVPVVGVILGHAQPEYGARQRHEEAERLVRALVRRAGVAPLPLDTRLDAVDELACATPDRFRAVVARLDAVVTTRLHGLVLALDAGVPALAVDPVAGGAKVTRQAEVLGWPAVCCASAADGRQLDAALRWCLTADARAAAKAAAQRGRDDLAGTRARLIELLRGTPAGRPHT